MSAVEHYHNVTPMLTEQVSKLTRPARWIESELADAAIAELEAELKQANVFIELLKGMVEQLEDGDFEEYDLQDLMRRAGLPEHPSTATGVGEAWAERGPG